jgi:hypothetical protein
LLSRSAGWPPLSGWPVPQIPPYEFRTKSSLLVHKLETAEKAEAAGKSAEKRPWDDEEASDDHPFRPIHPEKG